MTQRLLILTLCPVLSVFAASGATATWTGAVDNNWFNAGNWSGNVVPHFGDTATILNISNNPVILNNGGISNLTLGTGTSLNIGGKFSTGDPHTLNSAIQNNGSITLSAPTTLITSVTVSGSGTLTLVGDPAAQTGAQIGTAGPVWTLNNQGSIQGSGLIGASNYQLQMFDDVNLVNTGTIDANQTGATLRIAGLGPSRINLGVLEATNGGILELAPQLTPENGGVVQLPPPNPAFLNSGGTIAADGAGSVVNFLGATVIGGTLSTSNGGLIQTGTSAVLDGSMLGDITLSDGSNYLARTGTLTDLTGNLNLGSTTGSTFNLAGGLRLVGDVTITGPGTFNMAAGSEIGTDGMGRNLTLATNVQGAGLIGSANAPLSSNLTLINNGTVNANVTDQLLVVGGTGAVTNAGFLQATNGGILQLTSGPIAGGNFQADGIGSVVNVGTTLVGATLTSTNGGVFQTFGTATLDGASAGPTTLNGGTVYNAGAGTLTSITGGLTLNAGASLNLGGQLQLVGDTVLSGPGGLNMATGSEIGTNGGSFTLFNLATISGAGLIGSGNSPLSNNLNLVNFGVVNANLAGETLRIAASGMIANAGTLQATNGGTLEIGSLSPVDNGFGYISADGAGSYVNLVGATIRGGTFMTSNGGVIQTVGSAGLDGSTSGAITIAADSKISLPQGTNTTVQGNLILTGGSFSSIELGGQMTLAGNTSLIGNGILNMQAGSLITTNGAAVTLNNSAIVSGTGVIGANGDSLNLINNGTIINAAGDLTIGGSGLFTNNGALIAEGPNTLRVTSSLSNFSGGVLTGGAFQAYDGTLQLSSLGGAGGEIVSNASFILLSGAGARIVDGANLDALSGFQDNLAAGAFELSSGQQFSTAPGGGADFTTEGLFDVDAGATFTTTGNFISTGYTKVNGLLTVDGGEVDVNAGGILTGVGIIDASVVINPGGMLVPGDAPGTMTILGDYTLNGELEEDIAGTVASGLFGAVNLPGKATLGGILDIVLLNGFDPAPNSQNSYVILDAGKGVTGQFSAVNFANLGAGETFRLDYSNPDEVILDLDGTTTPEPAMYGFLGIGLAGLFALRRRRRVV